MSSVKLDIIQQYVRKCRTAGPEWILIFLGMGAFYIYPLYLQHRGGNDFRFSYFTGRNVCRNLWPGNNDSRYIYFFHPGLHIFKYILGLAFLTARGLLRE